MGTLSPRGSTRCGSVDTNARCKDKCCAAEERLDMCVRAVIPSILRAPVYTFRYSLWAHQPRSRRGKADTGVCFSIQLLNSVFLLRCSPFFASRECFSDPFSLVNREAESCVPTTWPPFTTVEHVVRKSSRSCECAEIEIHDPAVRRLRCYGVIRRGDRRGRGKSVPGDHGFTPRKVRGRDYDKYPLFRDNKCLVSFVSRRSAHIFL